MTDKNLKKTGQFKVIGGAVVIAPPDDDAPVEEKTPEVVLDATKGVITVKVEGDKDPSQVTDAESEALSNAAASEAREANQKAAEEAKVDVQARKAGNSVVAGGTFNDIDLPEYDKTAKKAEEKVEQKQEEEQVAQKQAEQKQAAAEEQFNAALQDALDEQSEEFVEAYEED